MQECFVYKQHPDGKLEMLGRFPCGISCSSVDFIKGHVFPHPFYLTRISGWRWEVVFDDGFDPDWKIYSIRS